MHRVKSFVQLHKQPVFFLSKSIDLKAATDLGRDIEEGPSSSNRFHLVSIKNSLSLKIHIPILQTDLYKFP